MRRSVASALLILVTACAADPGDAGDAPAELAAALSIPPDIAVPGDQHTVLQAHGVGFQIYQCAASDGGGRQWAFHAPAAVLFAPDGQLVASHFGGIDAGLPAGVYWMSTLDGSRVHGGNALLSPNPPNIPLVRLSALDTAGEDDGIFRPVTFIHRLATQGGAAPTGSCPRLGFLLPVFYQAEYVFYAAGLPRPETPSTIAVPAGHNLAHQFHAEGFQVYTCTRDASGALSFAFRAPRADLFDDGGDLEVKHFGGIEVGLTPGVYWQSVRDDSFVRAGNAITAPNPGNIPLVRLEKLETAGNGILSRVSFVQRLATLGGVAPAGACAPEGVEAAVPYSADYFFYIPTISGL